MISVNYACGCRETRNWGSVFQACPMHKAPPSRAVIIGRAALELAYGPQPPWPTEPYAEIKINLDGPPAQEKL